MQLKTFLVSLTEQESMEYIENKLDKLCRELTYVNQDKSELRTIIDEQVSVLINLKMLLDSIISDTKQ
jgi:hypothetical protein